MEANAPCASPCGNRTGTIPLRRNTSHKVSDLQMPIKTHGARGGHHVAHRPRCAQKIRKADGPPMWSRASSLMAESAQGMVRAHGQATPDGDPGARHRNPYGLVRRKGFCNTERPPEDAASSMFNSDCARHAKKASTKPRGSDLVTTFEIP